MITARFEQCCAVHSSGCTASFSLTLICCAGFVLWSLGVSSSLGGPGETAGGGYTIDAGATLVPFDALEYTIGYLAPKTRKLRHRNECLFKIWTLTICCVFLPCPIRWIDASSFPHHTCCMSPVVEKTHPSDVIIHESPFDSTHVHADNTDSGMHNFRSVQKSLRLY